MFNFGHFETTMYYYT